LELIVSLTEIKYVRHLTAGEMLLQTQQVFRVLLCLHRQRAAVHQMATVPITANIFYSLIIIRQAHPTTSVWPKVDLFLKFHSTMFLVLRGTISVLVLAWLQRLDIMQLVVQQRLRLLAKWGIINRTPDKVRASLQMSDITLHSREQHLKSLHQLDRMFL